MTARTILFASVFIGILFRFIFPDAVEFKADEAQMLRLALDFSKTHHLDFIGLHSSGGLRHPGFGNWIFILLSYLFDVQTPVGMARITSCFNSIALIVFTFLVERKIQEPRWKNAWRWGLAGMALNPFIVILSRKIWTPCLFPFFFSLILWFWSDRKTSKLSLFFWGFFGSLMAQVNLSGVYPIVILFLWTLKSDLKKKAIRWPYWIAGSTLGALPVLPWLFSLSQMSHDGKPNFNWVRLVMFKFWNFWLTTTQSWVTHANIGPDLFNFFPEPVFFGIPTYLFGIFCCFSFGLTALAAGFLILGLVRFIRSKKKDFWGFETDTSLLIHAFLIGQGLLMTFSRININNYYLLAFYPIPMVWFADCCLKRNWGKSVLHFWMLGHLVLSLVVLGKIHTQPFIQGDFGPPYWAQQK